MKHTLCKIFTFVLIGLAGGGFSLSFQAIAQNAYEIPNTQVLPIQDVKNDRNYELIIKLPEGYEEEESKNKRYPVVYHTDATVHIELLTAAASFLLEDSILVGISYQKDNDPKVMEGRGEYVSRYRDYSVWESDNPEHQAKFQFGQAPKHAQFIRDNVFSFVDNRFRTQPDNRTYFGYSLGGLFGAYILLSQPNTFEHYILGSPSVWKLDELEKQTKSNSKPLDANVFITHGSLEDELGPKVESFISYLKQRNDKTLSLTHEVIAGTHSTAFPNSGLSGIAWLADIQAKQ